MSMEKSHGKVPWGKRISKNYLQQNLDGPRSKTLRGTYIYVCHAIQTRSHFGRDCLYSAVGQLYLSS